MQERRSVSEAGLSGFFGRVYGNMALGLLTTAVVTGLLMTVFKAPYLALMTSTPMMQWVFMFLPLLFVILASTGNSVQNPGRARVMFLLMSASEGTTMSVIMMMTSTTTAVAALLVTAVIFGTMSMVGIFGKRDLSHAGNIAITALFGVIAISVLNFFMRSTGVAMLINYVILGIFIILVAADNQRLKQFYASAEAQGDVAVSSLAVQGAIMLYLDFLNLFLTIIQIFGIGGNNNN
ncbi:Bax inhibitor-1/YccA family protein [Lacticaseibacillus pabuli]|uniref:Bax inhibitor-1/YccA family protein n=1 Tax=Lacticaseibacillus pabuli TaxID=3025672 RepID=A0ABY7WTP6_9LACO|nr:Bax inhibitor-1/YccA family protein [Lacticaseibacillus sp. KACC 23028]WDF83533.1 Bax inhibitor-1/YccA family protein [Lacticaseibacillus sp. KACC 23028]